MLFSTFGRPGGIPIPSSVPVWGLFGWRNAKSCLISKGEVGILKSQGGAAGVICCITAMLAAHEQLVWTASATARRLPKPACAEHRGVLCNFRRSPVRLPTQQLRRQQQRAGATRNRTVVALFSPQRLPGFGGEVFIAGERWMLLFARICALLHEHEIANPLTLKCCFQRNSLLLAMFDSISITAVALAELNPVMRRQLACAYPQPQSQEAKSA